MLKLLAGGDSFITLLGFLLQAFLMQLLCPLLLSPRKVRLIRLLFITS